MPPPKRETSLSCICIIAEEPTEILANLHLSDRSERAYFNGDIVGVICVAVIPRLELPNISKIGLLERGENLSLFLELFE